MRLPLALSLRRLLLFVSVLLAAGGFYSAGHLITATDPVATADAVVVLGGSWLNRSMEAVRLYQEGKAGRILLSRGGMESEAIRLLRQGIRIPSDSDIIRDLLVNQLHLPAGAVVILPQIVDNTAQEAEAVQAMAAAERWTKLIVITDRSSTRRAGYAFRRVLGNGVQVIVTCSRYDTFNPGRWWASRWSARLTFYEFPKLLAYWMGLKG